MSDYNMLRAIHKERAWEKKGNEAYLNQLSHLITDYLKKCRSNSSGDTLKFVDHIFPEQTDYQDLNNRVITFNYDLILDKVLIDRGWSPKNIYFDRIVKREKYGTSRKEHEKFQEPLLLKLHGSLNWRCAQKDFEDIITGECHPTDKIPVWVSDKSPSPDDGHPPLIIPPIPNKPITAAPLFRHLWETAYEYLHEAKKIVIVGYSCPATDVMARSMFSNFNNKGVTDITIVDPGSNTLTEYFQSMELAVSKKTDWHYNYNFSDYIAGL